MEEESLHIEEDTDAAVDRRKFLLNRIFEPPPILTQEEEQEDDDNYKANWMTESFFGIKEVVSATYTCCLID